VQTETPSADGGADLHALFQRAFADEQIRTARLLSRFRLVGASLFLAVKTAFVLEQPEQHITIGVGALYWLLSLALFFAARASDRAARWSALAVPVLDLPLVFASQWIDLRFSRNPRALAEFTLALNIGLVLLAAFTLQPRGIYAAAAVAIAFQWILDWQAHEIPVGWVGAAVLILFVAAICHYARHRRVSLLRALVVEERRRERLGRYFSPQVAAQIQAEADALAAGRACEVTILFSDLRGFTALAEILDSAAVVGLLNELHARMVEAVFAHGGTLDKYLGDGLMAYFGAPIAQPDHAAHALRCALDMQAALGEINSRRAARGDPPLQMGIGLHTGRAVVGSIGAPHRREFTVVGDTVNLAARLEQLTKTFQVAIVLSEETARRAPGICDLRPVEPIAVRGKTQPVLVFTPVPPTA
jgi:adenylate cyclase